MLLGNSLQFDYRNWQKNCLFWLLSLSKSFQLITIIVYQSTYKNMYTPQNKQKNYYGFDFFYYYLNWNDTVPPSYGNDMVIFWSI